MVVCGFCGCEVVCLEFVLERLVMHCWECVDECGIEPLCVVGACYCVCCVDVVGVMEDL